MGLYQRRRPSPIKIFPNPVRRQEKETDSPDSPDSPQESGADSPDSPASTGAPSPAATQSQATTAPPPATTAPAIAPTSTLASSASSSNPAPVSSAPPPPPPPPPASSQTRPSTQSSSSVAPASTSRASSSAASSSASSSTRPAVPSITPGPPPNAAIGDDQEPKSPASPPSPTSSDASSTPIPSSSSGSGPSSPTSTGVTPLPDRTAPPRSQLSGSSGIEKEPTGSSGHAVLGKGAEAALITSAILGFVALLVGGWFLYKRRKRRLESQGVLTTENGFAPGPGGSQGRQETVQIGYDPGSNAHMTRSTNNTSSLFGDSHYQRPETVSTNSNSRAAPDQPLPTPNPFADPPRNKAFDQLRGRPRSTTLTDRGSWIRNPFRDPTSDRFDPFGELQEKARRERVKYMEEVRQEEMDRLEREREQQFLEKERMGLGVPEAARKGSGVTVDGVGVLDRSGSGGYR